MRRASCALSAAALGLAVASGCGSRTGLLGGAEIETAPDAGASVDAASPCGSQGAQGPVVLASGQNGPRALALDDTYVYWTNEGILPRPPSGTVMRAPKCGGTPVTLATNQNPSWSIAVDDTSVYWGLVPTGDIGNGAVVRLPKAGGPIVTLATNVYDALYVAIDGADVYWTSPVAEIVARVPKAGGAVTTLATSQDNPHEIAVGDTSVVWLNVGIDGDPGAIVSLPKGGGVAVTLDTGLFPSGLALDATGATWSFSSPPKGNVGPERFLYRVPLQGGPDVTIDFLPGGGSVTAIATDGVDAYVTDIGNGEQGAGFLRRVPLQPSPMGDMTGATIASSLSGPSAVAVDATSVYWLDDSGAVMKAPK